MLRYPRHHMASGRPERFPVAPLPWRRYRKGPNPLIEELGWPEEKRRGESYRAGPLIDWLPGRPTRALFPRGYRGLTFVDPRNPILGKYREQPFYPLAYLGDGRHVVPMPRDIAVRRGILRAIPVTRGYSQKGVGAGNSSGSRTGPLCPGRWVFIPFTHPGKWSARGWAEPEGKGSPTRPQWNQAGKRSAKRRSRKVNRRSLGGVRPDGKAGGTGGGQVPDGNASSHETNLKSAAPREECPQNKNTPKKNNPRKRKPQEEEYPILFSYDLRGSMKGSDQRLGVNGQEKKFKNFGEFAEIQKENGLSIYMRES